MSETMTDRPTAGWYPDPSSQAPFRWWDGYRWSTSTRLRQDEAPPEILRVASTGGELPSRRSLRTSSDAAAPHLVPHAPASPVDAAPFVPLNPLSPKTASSQFIGRETSRSTGGAWETPDAWIANSPTAQRQDHAVYGTGAPFGSTISRTPVADTVSPATNLGAGLALIGLLYQGAVAVWGASASSDSAGLAVAGALLVGLTLGVVGVARAGRPADRASRPRRSSALLVLVVCLAALGAQGSAATGTLVPGLVQPSHASSTQQPASPPRAPHGAPAIGSVSGGGSR